jgi:hypothetical protein
VPVVYIVWAQTSLRAEGEVASDRQTTINGSSAI